MNKFIFVFIYALVLLVGCNHKEQHENCISIFKVTSPNQRDTIVNREYVSDPIHAYQHIELRALEKGYLQKIFVDEGQFVKKGQLLFQIQPNIYQAEAEKAQSELEFAEVEYQNSKALAEKNVVSQSEVVLAKAKMSKAKVDLSLAQTHLKFTDTRPI